MSYGDEANDSEEKRYADQFNEDESEGGEEESEELVKVVPLAREFERRTNRGTRMTALVGKAQEEDDEFWGGIGGDFFGGGQEESED